MQNTECLSLRELSGPRVGGRCSVVGGTRIGAVLKGDLEIGPGRGRDLLLSCIFFSNLIPSFVSGPHGPSHGCLIPRFGGGDIHRLIVFLITERIKQMRGPSHWSMKE
jgi:hypothetical protein